LEVDKDIAKIIRLTFLAHPVYRHRVVSGYTIPGYNSADTVLVVTLRI